MTRVRVWISQDGYVDPDDNLAQLVGAAEVRGAARSHDNVSIAAVVFGDSTDGGQYRMLNPFGRVPARLDDGDSRLYTFYKNKIAAGNYAFYEKYGSKAIASIAPGWEQFDVLKSDRGGQRSWNYHPTSKSEMIPASWNLAQDIEQAIAKGGPTRAPNEVVVYSAGGGAHVPAEAIGYLLGQGFTEKTIRAHFAVVQHGSSNWNVNQEAEARHATRHYTIAISKQDPDRYANGEDGPGLKVLVRDGVYLDGSRFGETFRKALAVAQGLEPFENLGRDRTFRPTIDGSDAGSHAFAADAAAVLGAWSTRMRSGDNLPLEPNTGHLIKNGDDYRLRVIYDGFDWQDAVALLNGATAGKQASGPDQGQSLALGDADVFAFKADGSVGALGTSGGRLGVAGIGDPGTVDATPRASESLGVDPGDAIAAITLGLAGVARDEAVGLTAFDAHGAVLEHETIEESGRIRVEFDDEVRFVALEPLAGDRAEADFALKAVGFDYL